MLKKSFICITLASFLWGCNSGSSSSSPNIPESNIPNITFRSLKSQLPVGSQKINAKDVLTSWDAQTNSITVLLQDGTKYSVPVNTEVKNDILLKDTRASYDYDIANHRHHVIIHGDGSYQNTRKTYVYTSTDGNLWTLSHSFNSTNVSSDFVAINDTLYAGTTDSDLVTLDADGHLTPFVGHSCDGTAVVRLRRLHDFTDVGHPTNNILLATKAGSVCSYNPTTKVFRHLVLGNGSPLHEIVVNAQGTQFADINSEGALAIYSIDGKQVNYYQNSVTNSLDGVVDADSIVFTSRNLIIAKTYTANPTTRYFSIVLWDSKTNNLTKPSYYSRDEAQPYFPSSSDDVAVESSRSWGWLDDFGAALDVVAVVAGFEIENAILGVGNFEYLRSISASYNNDLDGL